MSLYFCITSNGLGEFQLVTPVWEVAKKWLLDNPHGRVYETTYTAEIWMWHGREVRVDSDGAHS
jgi:hypothetical protein